MDGQEYLNQISVGSKPVKNNSKNILSSKYIVLGMGALILLVLIIIIGSILGSKKNAEKNLPYALLLHINNTAELIQQYQPEVKSSNLRSSSASLYGVLTNTSRSLTNHLTEAYDYKEKNLDKKLIEEATLNQDNLEADLFEAKINGILDRIYAHKIAYEISILNNEEAKIVNITSDSKIKEILTTSQSGLEALYERFNSFSEAN